MRRRRVNGELRTGSAAAAICDHDADDPFDCRHHASLPAPEFANCLLGFYISVHRAARDVYPDRHAAASLVADCAIDWADARDHLWDDPALRADLSRRHPDVRQEADLAGNHEVDQVRVKSKLD